MDTKEQSKKVGRLEEELRALDAKIAAGRAELAEAKEGGRQPRTNSAEIAALVEERGAVVTALEKARVELADFEAARKNREHKDAVKAIAGKQEDIRKIADEMTELLRVMQAKGERAQELQNEITNILQEHGAGMERSEQDRVRWFAPFRHCLHLLQMANGKISLLETSKAISKGAHVYLP